MKFNKLMMAAMMVGAVAFVACKNNENPPVPTPTPTPDPDPQPVVEIPEVDAPADGYVTLVINIPANTECNGIAFKGTLNGSTWTGANEYLNEEGPADKDHCIKFEAIADYKNWYKATYKLGAEAWNEGTLMAGKICLIYTNDGSWEGQFVNWSINDEYSTADNGKSGDGNIEIYGSGLVYVMIGGWQGSECATPEEYNITVIVPAFCEDEFPIELIGSFCGWADDKTVALNKVEGNKYAATITATENAEWKVRGVGGWDKEIQGLIEEGEDAGQWTGVANNVLGKDLNVTVDYSNPDKYRWNVCVPNE